MTAVGAPSGAPPDARPARLLVSPGWVVEDLAERRLRLQLAQAPESVVAVAATPGPLPAGATYRSFAARRALLPLGAATAAPPDLVARAVLVADGEPRTEADGGFLLPSTAGEVLVDPGAHVHELHADAEVPHVAVDLARSPFRRRPTVVLAGLHDDAERWSWAQETADALVRCGLHAVVAVPRMVAGSRLSRPCAPSAASLLALDPDAVLMLDDQASTQVPVWVAKLRRTVTLQCTEDADVDIELLSWRIGEARGRLRARVGPDADPVRLAGVIERLCAGPQPLPPAVEARHGAAEDLQEGAGALAVVVRGRRRPRAQHAHRSVAVLAGHERPSSPAVEALLDRLDEAGVEVLPALAENRRRSAAPDLPLLVPGPWGSGAFDRLAGHLDDRRQGGAPVVALVTSLDVRAVDGDLTDSAAEVVRAAGAALVPSGAVAHHVRRLGARALVTGPLCTTVDEQRWRAASLWPRAPRLYWRVDSADGADGATVGAVVAALRELLAEHSALSVALAGRAVRDVTVPASVADRFVASDDTEPSRPLGAIWTADGRWTEVVGDVLPLVGAGFAGVPTAVARDLTAARHVGLPHRLRANAPDDPSSWLEVLRPLVAQPSVRDELAAEVERAAHALFAAHASALALERFLGWLERGAS